MNWNEIRTKYKWHLAIGLFIIIFGTLTFLIINWDEAFTQTTTVTYGDGCKETYQHGVITSPICESGRLLTNTYQDSTDVQWNIPINLTGLNVS